MMHKKIVVQKYGGSSVSDIEGILHVAKRIAQTVQAGWSVVVVVSAMGNTTDSLNIFGQSNLTNPHA